VMISVVTASAVASIITVLFKLFFRNFLHFTFNHFIHLVLVAG
jgi:hypothetical protein